MQIISSSEKLDGTEGPFAVAIGVFDGVHLGHQALLHKTLGLARNHGIKSLAYTFDPHPAKVLAPDLAPKLIDSIDERCKRIGGQSLDSVLVERFDANYARTSPEDFVLGILVNKLQTQHVVVGEGFRFGAKQAGDIDLLSSMGRDHQFDVHPMAPVSVDGIMVSSTKVRAFVAAGQMRGATLLLGRPYTMTGTVMRGAGRGSALGIPTANLRPDTELVPGRGVYAAVARGSFGKLPAVVNVGYTPTFGSPELKIEIHILNFESRPLYGEILNVAFLEKLRDETKFAGPEDLIAQIHKDIEAARNFVTHRDIDAFE